MIKGIFFIEAFFGGKFMAEYSSASNLLFLKFVYNFSKVSWIKPAFNCGWSRYTWVKRWIKKSI